MLLLSNNATTASYYFVSFRRQKERWDQRSLWWAQERYYGDLGWTTIQGKEAQRGKQECRKGGFDIIDEMEDKLDNEIHTSHFEPIALVDTCYFVVQDLEEPGVKAKA